MIEHRPPEGRETGKTASMLQRLLLDASERPDDIHSLYFLHRQYLHMRDYAACIEWGERYLGIAQERRLADAYANLADAHACLGAWQTAFDYLHQGLAAEPLRRSWWLRIAEMHIECEEWDLALAYLHGAARVPLASGWMSEPHLYAAGLMQMMAKCELQLYGEPLDVP